MKNKPLLLVADDDSAIISAVEKILGDLFTIRKALSVKEAVSMLAIRRDMDVEERYAVAVIDLSFGGSADAPGVEGFEVLKAAMLDEYLEPIIFTGTGDQLKASKSMEYGAFRYVIKSSSRDGVGHSKQLRDAAESALDLRKNLIELSSILKHLRKDENVKTDSTLASLLYQAEQIENSIMHARRRR